MGIGNVISVSGGSFLKRSGAYSEAGQMREPHFLACLLCWQPRYLEIIPPKTGGFASPPFGEFALSFRRYYA
jgi:hypothetical protein